MADYEGLFRRVAQQLLEKERATGKTGTWSDKEIQAQLEAEAKQTKFDLGHPTPMDTAKRIMRIHNYYLEMKDKKPDPRKVEKSVPQYVAVFESTMPISPKLQRKAEELGFHPDGDWHYIDPKETDVLKMALKHPRTDSDNGCPVKAIPVRISHTEDGIDYLLAYCETCSSGWWSARRLMA
jgi:hypothetical protein